MELLFILANFLPKNDLKMMRKRLLKDSNAVFQSKNITTLKLEILLKGLKKKKFKENSLNRKLQFWKEQYKNCIFF